jgi:hypothetical protein
MRHPIHIVAGLLPILYKNASQQIQKMQREIQNTLIFRTQVSFSHKHSTLHMYSNNCPFR